MTYRDLLLRFARMSREVFGNNLTGIYLHGSAVMGCFHPRKSDLDLIAVVKGDIPNPAKLEFMRNVIKYNEEAPAKGMELSVVKREYCNPFVYPTPFELHFSAAHLRRFRENPEDYIEKMRGTDRDLAAHFTILKKYGTVVWGDAIDRVFGEVPREDYMDSILSDVGEAREGMLRDPMYFTLNLCRVAAFLREGLILSKKAGGEWGLHTLPGEFHPLIDDALKSYNSDGQMEISPERAQSFADYMLHWIEDGKRERRGTA